MTHTTQLLIIDPQNDFCDVPEAYRPTDPRHGERLAPGLPVAGAHADMQRLARFIDASAERLDAITVTLDSHHRVDIAHPTFWARGNGAPVEPFTAIAAAQVRGGDFAPRDRRSLARALAYLDALEAGGRCALVVWPVHCEVGTWGHAVHADVQAAYARWEERRQTQVAFVLKGLDPWTEHYSALQAEVPSPDVPSTQLDRSLLARLDQAEHLLIAGEAGSHCVRATVDHLVEHLPGQRLDRLVLLTDCISPVGGFEEQQAAFFDEMRRCGVRLMTAAQAHVNLTPTAVAE
jgi:nicotinamidase/pyrazinamidase